MNKKWLFIISVVIIFFALKHFLDYGEKDLNRVIGYDLSKFESLVVNKTTEQFEWRTDQTAHAETLQEFLSSYRVKRMKDYEWDSDVSKEKGFTLSITLTDKAVPITADIFEKRILFYNEGKYYQVLNYPIDVEWVYTYVTEQKQEKE
ncbi:hypothetical protein IMZ31_20305 (plasmid) [Pontibacillus sp. ALD_SL1]|uniref:hypothetical protein n=1 Tax=Pontibacillus sp. ALD_SL1 TaxID=2777185 RepID=UPI001A9650D1|nr:hypothetical protein [Pontibacillus sp. ALD_SL1]QST02893.1 hypothetical protein IMZ31_20305 [Pontibacillus sp. ALD_SL1]